MPEIKNTFLKGKMNKDLDERLIPNGEYRDALNVKVSTSEDSEVGTIQTILGNERADALVPNDHVCVGSVSDEKTNKLYWFTKTSSVDLILEYDQNTQSSQYVFVDTKTNTDDAVLKFPDRLITGINVIDNLLFWTDGITEPKKINITNCIIGTIQDPLVALTSHTQLVVNGVNTLTDIKEENITVIKKKPNRAPVANIVYAQNTGNSNDKNSLFERTFSRFSLRYKYDDGEVSAFGPFSDVVFNPQYISNTNYDELATVDGAKENNFTRKEPFNRAMVNKIDKIEIFDFVSPEMPGNVVEVEILYKQEDSPIIYSIAKLDINDNSWQQPGFNEGHSVIDSEYKGKYTIETENIYAALPENQFIRVFDNVPRYALAQEVTGSRIVYGNYTQNYDILRDEYNHEVRLEDRINTQYLSNDGNFDLSPQKSLKSLRNYQLGVVYGDKYGRETPVFTTERAAVSIPWQEGSDFNASKRLSLVVDNSTNYPTWADYFKYYVKETSTEYYNLIMDKAFVPTSQDDVDRNLPSDHIWLSFFSSDRNKITEEDHIILKKIFGTLPGQITQNNKFKVIDVKNEAPESIQFDTKRVYVEVNQQTLNDIFDISSSRITDTVSQIKLDFDEYISAGGYDFLSTDRTGDSPTEPQFKVTDHYIIWQDNATTGPTAGQVSRRYRIDNAIIDNTEIILKLDRAITTEDANIADVNSSTNGTIKSTLQFEVERKQRRELDQFSGRFFVKIAFNNLASQIQDVIPDLINAFTPVSTLGLRHFIDEVDSNSLDPSSVAVNNDNTGATAYTSAGGNNENVVNGITLASGVTNTKSDWNALTEEISSESASTDADIEFFIDGLYYCAGNWGAEIGQPFASRAVNIQRGNGTGSGGDQYVYVEWKDTSYYDDLPWRANNGIIDVNGAAGANSKNYYPYVKYTNTKEGPHSTSGGGTNLNAGNNDFIDYNGPDGVYGSGDRYDSSPNGLREIPGIDLTGTTLQTSFDPPVGGAGQISTNYAAQVPMFRWFPFDKDNHNMGGLDGIDAYYNNTNTPWRGAVVNVHPNSSNITGDNVTFPIRFFHKSIYKDTFNPGNPITENLPPSHYGLNGYQNSGHNATEVVNALEGFIVSTNEHTTGSRTWRKENIGSVFSNFSSDDTYGSAGDEGKFYIHLTFLAPGQDLTDSTFSLPSNLDIQGNNSLGKHLQGIHGGGVFTKSYKQATDDGFDAFDNTDNWDSPRTIHCEGSTNNTLTLDLGHDPNFQNLHDEQWDPTKTPYGDPNGTIAGYINLITTTGAKFIFAGDTNNTVYTILSTSRKYLYNHTPWRRRYIRDTAGSAPINSSYQDDWALNGKNIAANDSVEEAAVTWAKSKALNEAQATQTANRDALSQKIQDFGKRNNRRVVYIIEIDKNPTDATVNGGYNPFDADNDGGSGITAASSANLQFISNVANFSQGSSSIFPAIWETEPKKNTDLEVYYEVSKAVPLNINSFNRETLATVGCEIKHESIQEAITAGTPVFLEGWREEQGEQIAILNPGLNSQYPSTIPIDYDNTYITFISKDGSFVNAQIEPSSLTASASGGYFTEFSIRLNQPSTITGLSYYNSFSFGNGIESNRIRDDFNQMQITNGARASAVLEEPYSVENKKSSLIYSGIYNSTSNINNLNQFIAGEKITKDLNPTYGSIQKLFQRRISLVAFCEDRVVSIVSNKDALFNADGNSQLISTNRVLGDATPFVGDYGISKNPESFAKESYRAYFTDKNRGAVLRLSKDGITPISQAGMHDWFRDNLPLANKILGSYDEYNQDYNISLIVDLPNYNLIQNSFVERGSEFVSLGSGTEKVIDGSLNSSTNYDFPKALPWQNDNSFSNADSSGMGLKNQDLISEVKIIKHELIPAGSFQTYQPATTTTTITVPAESYIAATYSNNNPDNYGSSSQSQLIYGYATGHTLSGSINIFNPDNGAGASDSHLTLGTNGEREAYILRFIDESFVNPLQAADYFDSSDYSFYNNGYQFDNIYIAEGMSGDPIVISDPHDASSPLSSSNQFDLSWFNDAGIMYASKGTSSASLNSGPTPPGPGRVSDATESSLNYGDAIQSSYNSFAHSIRTNDTDLCVYKGEVIIVEYHLRFQNFIVNSSYTYSGVPSNHAGNSRLFHFSGGEVLNSSMTQGNATYDNPATSYAGSTYPLPNGGEFGTDGGSITVQCFLIDGNNFTGFASLSSLTNGTVSPLTGNELYYESYKDMNNNDGNYWITDKDVCNPQWYSYGNGGNARVRQVFKFPEHVNAPDTSGPTLDDLLVTDDLRVVLKFKPSGNMVPNNNYTGPAGSTIYPGPIIIKDFNVYKADTIASLPDNSVTQQSTTTTTNMVPGIPTADVPEWHEIIANQPYWTTDRPDLVNLHAVATNNHGVNTGSVSTNSATDTQGNVWVWQVDPLTNSFGTANTDALNNPYVAGDIYQTIGVPTTAGDAMSNASIVEPSHIKTYNDQIEITPTTSNPSNVNIYQTLTNAYQASHFYLLDAVTSKSSSAVRSVYSRNYDNTNKNLFGIRGIFDPSSTVVTDTDVSFEQSGYPGYPYHHFGRIRGSVNSASGRRIQALFVDPTKDATNDYLSDYNNIYHETNVNGFINVNQPFLHSLFNYASYAADTNVLRSIYKMDSNSNHLANDPGLLNINIFQPTEFTSSGNIGAITSLRLIDLGLDTTGGTHYSTGSLTDWNTGNSAYQQHLMVTPRNYVNNNVSYHNGLMPNVLSKEGNPAFTNPSTGAHFSQRYSNPGGQGPNEIAELAPPATDSGYEFRFDFLPEHLLATNYGGCFCNVNGVDGKGFRINDITQTGRYKIIANVDSTDDPIVDGTVWSIEYDPAYGTNWQSTTATLVPRDVSAQAPGSFGRFYGNVFFGADPNNEGMFAFGVSNISLVDRTAYYIAPFSPSWIFVNNTELGFNWSNGQLVINSAYRKNAIVGDPLLNYPNAFQDVGFIPQGQKIRFSVDYADLGGDPNANIEIFYVNSNLKGFYLAFGAGDNGNILHPNASELTTYQEVHADGSSGTFEAEVEVGDLSNIEAFGNLTPGSIELPYINRLVIRAAGTYGGSTYESITANYSLDNFSMVPFTPINISQNKTISFSEDVNGWTSFKSFAPESALSLSKKYYTFHNGGLYKHDVETNGYNNFYGTQFDSSVTAIFNAEPSMIKSFKTLSYEGSKSRVSKFVTTNIVDSNNTILENLDTLNYSHVNNLEDVDGWYVENISTNKQDGFVDEFIEKEGKWFNYIKGGLVTIDQDYISKHTGDLSFQGIGEIGTIQDVTLTDTELNDIDPLEPGTSAANAPLPNMVQPVLQPPGSAPYTPPSDPAGSGNTSIY